MSAASIIAKISAYEVHQWLNDCLQLEGDEVNTTQTDGIKQVYIKFFTAQQVANLLQRTNGHALYEYANGETSRVRIYPAGIGLRNISVANLPPEVLTDAIKRALEFDTIHEVKDEMWSHLYRYKVTNGLEF